MDESHSLKQKSEILAQKTNAPNKYPPPLLFFFPQPFFFLSHLSLGMNIKHMLFLSPLCAQAATRPVNLASLESTATRPAPATTRTVIPCLGPATSVRKASF